MSWLKIEEAYRIPRKNTTVRKPQMIKIGGRSSTDNERTAARQNSSSCDLVD